MEENNMKNSVYKYRDDNEWTYKGIKDGELYLSPASKLNDEFELMPYVDLTCFSQIKSIDFNAIKFDEYDDVRKRILENLKQVGTLDTEDFFTVFKQFLEVLKNEYGITSLSENGESPIMWGHYGDEGRGILIEYDLNDLEEAMVGDLLYRDVDYGDEKFDMSDTFLATLSGEINDTAPTSDTLVKLLEYCFIKSSDWQYEKEIRIVSQKLRGKTFKLKPKSITLGGNMLAIERIKYIELAKELGIELKRADIFNTKNYAIKSVVYTEKDIEETYKVAEDDKHIDVDLILQSLSAKRPVFYSEADFQFSFAKELEFLYPAASVRLEYISNKIKGMHIDIWVNMYECVIPIELKYKTKKCSISYNDEIFDLKSHSANDLGMYDVVRDIERIEKVKGAYDNCREGYVICITNDQGYFKKRDIKGKVQYEDFCISQDTKIPKHPRWRLNPSPGTIRGRTDEINLTNNYTCNWNGYSEVENVSFKSIVFKVDNN